VDFRNICQNIETYITKCRDTHTYITKILKNIWDSVAESSSTDTDSLGASFAAFHLHALSAKIAMIPWAHRLPLHGTYTPFMVKGVLSNILLVILTTPLGLGLGGYRSPA
jgi:hypothetical protein